MASRGRPKGSRDAAPRLTAARKAAAAVSASGLSPLQYMLRVMRNPKADAERRDRMAVAAAPFIHPRLANVQHQAPDEDGVFRFLVESVPPA